MAEPAPEAPLDGTARLRFTGTLDADSWGVGYWVKFTGTEDLGDLTLMAGGMYDAWSDAFMSHLSSSVTLVKAHLIYYNGTTNPEAEYVSGDVGAVGGAFLPANVSAVISWQIASTYRGGKPRSYLCGIPAAAQENANLVSDAYVADYTADAISFASELRALSYGSLTAVDIGCQHFFRHNAAITPYFDSFSAAQCQKRICTQRRRLGKLVA